MTSPLTATAALVTGASSGIGRATALELARLGSSVAVVARRLDRLDTLVAEITDAGGTALAISADVSERDQAEQAVSTAVEHFGRLDILVNNAGLMLLGRVCDVDVDEWDQMIAINQKGLLYTTHAAVPHLLDAAKDGPRQVADIVNISSLAGRTTFPTSGVYSMTKFGVNGFSEALRQELAPDHVRVGVLEPGKVDTELDSHNNAEILADIEKNFGGFTMLDPHDIADGVAYMVTRPAHAAIGELWVMPTAQA
ncbi:NADP-dependent 3-hydroxy acid dehydrogenase YdfG [Microlunatus sagamiharensis]|uniref:NADP-dependent 3-hydroxy acid dehydrogenase YdfG n=1 Tax=Microlunatus sagamiharensis TaxID=546874 RepID=A0A1H2N2F5_9ACTN|nr:SDR family NAD(P)-dependent oxidoreductase [Microlunatus sagamiharensis]SDU99438.1 NADP-dependent 3-hydroxy acid dehydrogenase YdfG [Microlunatus sagamiharensis]